MGVFYIISVILTPTMLRLTLGLLCFLPLIWGHGRMPNPPGRPTMWRYGFKNPPNYNDNELFCGGFQNQMKHGYKCGLCGDPYQGPRAHEAGGKYANGIIVKTYEKESVIPIDVDITANHLGWIEFKLCPWNNPTVPITQECLDKYPLQIVDSKPKSKQTDKTKNHIGSNTGNIRTWVQLPAGVTCEQCVIQWRYHTGNAYNCDKPGSCCLGCGPQEEFYSC